ncbi:MAG TPA: hypothetical protein VND19_10730 [Acetobacteraceae bacterium]|nr:hypothetical protein [Acetobacteraceae bacterium]
MPAFAAQIWLGPRSPNAGSSGSADWHSLFQPTTAWSQLASHIQVFMVTAGYVMSAPDAELRAMGADLAARHIGLAIPVQSIAQVPGEACGHEEGYGPTSDSARTAARLAALGVPLQYIRVDEPLWFGHYDKGPQGCRLPVVEIARRVAQNVRAYLRVFPGLVVGTVEPVPGPSGQPGWAKEFRAFQNALATDTGKPITFMHVDVDWHTPHWADAVKTMAGVARADGLQFGVIYNGDGLDKTGADWVAAAWQHVIEIESGHGVRPDQAVFQTWDQHPDHVLPLMSDSSLGGMVSRYLLPKTHIVATRSNAGIQGRLVDAAGRPVAGARVRVQVIGADPSRPLPVRTVSGIVPANARFAILGMRVNTECNCAGANDLMVGKLAYAETAGGDVRQTYDMAAQAPRLQAGSKGGAVVRTAANGGRPAAHVLVQPGQKFGFNSPAFPVTPGAHFEFKVPLGAVGNTGLFGTVAVIWLNAKQQGLSLASILLPRDMTEAATVTTGADGRFVLPRQVAKAAGGRRLRLEFEGSAGDRGAVAYIE